MLLSILVGCGKSYVQSSVKAVEPTEETSENNTEPVDQDTKTDYKISVSSVAISGVLAEMNQDIVGRPTTKLEIPEQYISTPEIGSSFSPDFEKVLEVGTNLLIGDASFKEKLEKPAAEYGIETFFIGTGTYAEFINGIDQLGEKLNKQSEAKNIIDNLQAPLKEIKASDNIPTIAIIFGSSESNMLATAESYIGSLADAIGAINIADNIAKENSMDTSTAGHGGSSQGYINLNLEQILKAQPDIIIRFAHGNVEQTKESFKKLFDESPVWSKLNAVSNNKVFDLDYNIFGVSANLKMGDALRQLGEIIYGSTN